MKRERETYAKAEGDNRGKAGAHAGGGLREGALCVSVCDVSVVREVCERYRQIYNIYVCVSRQRERERKREREYECFLFFSSFQQPYHTPAPEQ